MLCLKGLVFGRPYKLL